MDAQGHSDNRAPEPVGTAVEQPGDVLPAAGADPAAAGATSAAPRGIEVTDLDLYYGAFHAVRQVTMSIKPNAVTAFIGSSGCGKSTVLRSLNRMHEMIAGARVEGSVLDRRAGHLRPDVDPVACVRRKVGHGLPDAQSLPDDVHLRQRRVRA